MHERNLETEHPLSRHLVDQLGAARGELGDRGSYVCNLIRDVMHARAPGREKPSDRRIVAERREQLDPALAHADRRRLDSLLVDARPMLEAAAKQALVRTHRLVEVHDCEADMVNPSRFHVSDATAVGRIR